MRRQKLRQWTSKAAPPLHLAAKYSKNHKIIKTLLKNGANIRAKDEDNHTPLELAEARSDDDKKIADKEITGDIIDTLTLSSWRSLLSTFGLENIWDEWGLMGIILFWSLLITGMLI